MRVFCHEWDSSMNILLIRGKPTFMDFIVGIPIGLAYIAPIAQQKGHHVEILDLALEEDPDRVLRLKLAEREWQLAGFTCMTAEWEGAALAGRTVKELVPGAITVFGGYGYFLEQDVERRWRDNRIIEIYEGTVQVQLNNMVRLLKKLNLDYIDANLV